MYIYTTILAIVLFADIIFNWHTFFVKTNWNVQIHQQIVAEESKSTSMEFYDPE